MYERVCFRTAILLRIALQFLRYIQGFCLEVNLHCRLTSTHKLFCFLATDTKKPRNHGACPTQEAYLSLLTAI